MLNNDDTRCNGAGCDRAADCERYTSHSTNSYVWMHHAHNGCIGFIDNGKAAQVVGQRVEGADPVV